MENFGKLVYNQKHEEKLPEKPTQESIASSEKAAFEKLQKINNPDYKNFAVRYININEYRDILETGKFETSQLGGIRELTLFHNSRKYQSTYPNRNRVLPKLVDASGNEEEWSDEDKRSFLNPGFVDWMRSKRYLGEIDDKTMTPDGLASMRLMRKLLRLVQKTEDGKKTESWLEKLREIRKEILSVMERGTRIEDTYGFRAGEIKPEDLKESPYKDILLRFKNDENYLERSGALREVISAIAYLQGEFQYHIALILDDDVFNFPEPKNHVGWTQFPKGSDGKVRGVIAAISLVPLKELQNEMIDLEKGSGEFAHPIFDWQGSVKWPKK